MKLLVLAKSPGNPATRYRVTPIVDRLKAIGSTVHVVYGLSLPARLRLLFSVSDYDIVFIQRRLFHPLFVRALRFFARKIVFDHDDAIFLKSSGAGSATRCRSYRAITGAADLVIAGNDYLCQTAGRFAEQVVCVPTSIDVRRYHVEVEKEPVFTMVWIGSQSTSKYLEQHRPALEKIGQVQPGIQLKVIGDFQFQLEHLQVKLVPWSEATEILEIASSHIGIAPMEDNAWTRGKCALKVIQYMAAGLPVVSSDVGANREVTEHGQTGYLVKDEDGWIRAITDLRESVNLRERLGRQGQEKAARCYDIESAASRVVSLMNEIVELSDVSQTD